MQDEQIARYIQESSDRVYDVGWDNADLKDVLMMAIGYMRPPKRSKKLIAGGVAGLVAAAAALVEGIKTLLS